MKAIEVLDLKKTFKTVSALDGVSFSIEQGECFGLLGPNGAGKTTLIRILTTLLRPTSGKALVMGFDVNTEKQEVRKKIGVLPQAMTSDLDLTGLENMDIHARFYEIDKGERIERINGLFDMVGLKERRGDLVATYSGGMRRRLEVARALIHHPEVLILDEPTLGLDPQTRHAVWDMLKKFRTDYKLTILLTTHYMEEAEALCDRVGIIDYGKIAALDTVDGLKKNLPQKDIVELSFSGVSVDALIKDLTQLAFVHSVGAVEGVDGVVRVFVEDGASKIPYLVERVRGLGGITSKVLLKELSLEDVFIHFTGRPIREEEAKKVSFFIGAGVPRRWGR